MAEKKVVVHPGRIMAELQRKNISPRRRGYLENAMQVIDSTLNSAHRLVVTEDIPVRPGSLTLGKKYLDGDVYLLREDNTTFLRDCVQEGDDVEVFGAYRRICVRWAIDDIKSTGANAIVSRRGTVI
jgi:hypothetical protein